LEAREASIAKNLDGLDSSAKQESIGEELIVIQEKRLYRAAGIKSFKGYLDTRRNPISRSRAYQLIRFAKEKRGAALAGKPIPANERQSRAAKDRMNQLGLFEQRWIPVYKYLRKKFFSCPPHERGRFAYTLAVVAKGLIGTARHLNEEAEQNKDKTQQTPDL
jgi:hypothetical protein